VRRGNNAPHNFCTSLMGDCIEIGAADKPGILRCTKWLDTEDMDGVAWLVKRLLSLYAEA